MRRILFSIGRSVLLALSAALGYALVYVPLMTAFFDKENPLAFFLILALSITAAFQLARLADSKLPRLVTEQG